MQPIVHDFRPRAAQWLAATGALAMLPFAYSDFVRGHVAFGLGLFGLSLSLWLGVLLLRRGRYSPSLVVAVFGVPAIVVNTIAMTRFDVFVNFWAFVVVTAFYLVLPLRWALTMSGLMVVISAPVTWIQHGVDIGSRYAVCLVLIALFAAVAVRLIDDRERLLVTQMSTDPLTGLLNRTTLMPALTTVAAAASAAAPAVLLTVDIDHFKSINDRFGHEAGDRVLVGFAALAVQHFGRGTAVFRLGGEEFLAVVGGVTRSDAEAIGDRFRRGVESHGFLDGHTVTVSIGLAERVPGEPVGDWLRRADQALYRAKDAGRNALVVA